MRTAHGLVGVIGGMQGRGPAPSLPDALRRMHFDLAGMPVPEMLWALLKVAIRSFNNAEALIGKPA